LLKSANRILQVINSMTTDRVVPLTGVHNFRDYGGYALSGGGHLKRGILWRSAQHEAATDEDLEQIDAFGLSSIVDLRGDDERQMHPCRRSPSFQGQVLFAGGTTAGLAPHLAAAKEGIDAQTARARMIETYRSMPYRHNLVSTMKLYFKALSEDDKPSLIHCVAGKDRTGLSVSLLHHLMGVHADDAMEDYLLTNSAGNIDARIAQGGAHLRARYEREISDDAIRALMSVEEDYIQSAFTAIAEQHGGLTQYAETVLGVDATMREQLIMRLSA
jgi:protein-tyrosine phosphatase